MLDRRAYVEAAHARAEGEEYRPALARALGLTVDQVGAFRDVGAYVAAVESGTVDGEELRARHAVIRFHWRELGEQGRRALRRMLRRGQDRRRRARLAAVEREAYTREEIGERDGWECGHCLTPVPREADPRAPQVDHITAIAEGGADTRDNVTISHRYCNADRWGLRRRCSTAQAAERLARAVVAYEAR
ncbi:HNH endonuclease signature motif containing protein [Streptomyces sp. NPDC007095]|uniref:HNH endonuclease n=1 Tax=Streptomyces sp. NPDC007095 TaxID=3154482 RepID=UPI000CAACC20